MTGPSPPLLWNEPGWRDDVSAWIHTRLTRQGRSVVGRLDPFHVRPWSTVWRVPTARGDVYFKACAPGLSHEAAVTAALARWRPELLPPLLAVDERRGWLLLGDAGDRLREALEPPEVPDHWRRLLPRYAALQIELADRLPTLLGLGVPDRRLARLPDHYQALLAERQLLGLDRPDGLSPAAHARLRALGPHFAGLCRRLAGFGLPETLNHGDLHDGNIFWQAEDHRIVDWGDCQIGHPFFTLTVSLRHLAWRLDLPAGAPQLAWVRPDYLEAWIRFAPRSGLNEALDLALRIGAVNQALTWRRAVGHLPPAQQAGYVGNVSGWLEEFLRLESEPGPG